MKDVGDLGYAERVLQDEALAIRMQCESITDEAFKRDSIRRAEGCEFGAKLLKMYREFESEPLKCGVEKAAITASAIATAVMDQGRRWWRY